MAGREFFAVRTVAETLAGFRPGRRTGIETVPLATARGRVPSEPVRAPHDLPGFAKATVDGYAVRAADTYGASEGLRTVLVERTATGGQAGQSSRIENYLGFPDGVSGAQLTDRARRQATKFGAELITTREAVELSVCGSARRVTFADGDSINAHTVILATGVSYRQLPASGSDRLTGRGVFYGSALTEAANCTGRDVYVVGGANSAGQAAVYLAKSACSVTCLVRGKSLEESMSYYLIQQIANIDNITVRTCTEVVEVHGSDHLEQLTLLLWR